MCKTVTGGALKIFRSFKVLFLTFLYGFLEMAYPRTKLNSLKNFPGSSLKKKALEPLRVYLCLRLKYFNHEMVFIKSMKNG